MMAKIKQSIISNWAHVKEAVLSNWLRFREAINKQYSDIKEQAAERQQKADQGYYEFVPSAVAILEKPPAYQYRLVSWLVMGFVTITILWLCLAKVDIVISAQGKIVPAGKVKVLQSADDGVVKHIFVHDGQVVKAGDPLIEMDSTYSQADQQQIELNLVKARLTVQRLNSELGDQDVTLGDGIENTGTVLHTQTELLTANQAMFKQHLMQLQYEVDQAVAAFDSSVSDVEKLRTKITHLQQRYQKRVKQAERGLVAGKEVEDVKFSLDTAKEELQGAQANLAESKARKDAAIEKLAAIENEHNSDLYQQLAEAEHELKSIEQELVKAKERVALQVLRAPVNGVIQQLAVNTIGGYITRAQNLMVIVPEGTEMELDAMILNKDIGFVTQNQEARVKVDAFEFTRYGYLLGDLQWVASDAVLDEKRGQVYPVRIAIKETILPNRVNNRIAQVVPGMSASVDIVIGQRRLIQYFLGPLLRYKDESLRER